MDEINPDLVGLDQDLDADQESDQPLDQDQDNDQAKGPDIDHPSDQFFV